MYNRSTPLGVHAALKQDGSVVTWGDSWSGWDSINATVSSSLTSNVQIYSTRWAFAALKQDGSVVTWNDLGLVEF